MSEFPELKVLIGIPGSGKTNWTKKNNYHLNHVIVCPDDIRSDVFKNINDQENNTRVFDIAHGMIRTALLLKRNIILDATNCNTKYRREFLGHMPYCHMTAVLFDTDPYEASERIRKDIQRSALRCDVPEYVVFRMYGEYLHTKKVIEEEHFNNIIYAYEENSEEEE